MTTRRALLEAAGATLLARAPVARAQTDARKRRIAYLAFSTPGAGGRYVAQFTSGLRDLGWIEGSKPNVRHTLGAWR